MVSDTPSDPLCVNLSPFECLEEVQLELDLLNYSVDWSERVLQTITSNLVHKVTLNFIPAYNISPSDVKIDLSIWSRLNTTFMKMANKLDGAEKGLEVVFHFEAQEPKHWQFEDTVRFERKQIPQDLDNMNPDLGDLLPVMMKFLASRPTVETQNQQDTRSTVPISILCPPDPNVIGPEADEYCPTLFILYTPNSLTD